MSLFSPITNRSASTRALYVVVYLLLAAGALTMIVPLLITISGAMGGAYEPTAVSLYPRFLFSERALWSRFVEARYGGSLENAKMAWESADLDFYTPIPVPEPDEKMLALWKEYRRERGPLPYQLAGLTNARWSNQHASLENMRFRKWLMDRYEGSLTKLNEALLVDFPVSYAIVPPAQNRIVKVDAETPYIDAFREYLKTVSDENRLIWNIGGFYRAVYLPRIYGNDINRLNAEAGTRYTSFREVPFSAEVPGVAANAWFRFLTQVLNPAFIEFTPEGETAFNASGLNKIDFVKVAARPEHLRVVSVDLDFAEWARARGVADARIPQAQIDWEIFQKEKSFWRWQFATQNFRQVIDGLLVHGNGARNTIILVLLSVAGALTVNPMAAYSLSRFKLKQSYQVLLFFLATIAFPAEVAMIPNFLQIKEFGMINTFWALIIPGLVNGFSIFLLKGFFDSLPRELYEAADIDGASEWQIFWGITMSLSKPILAVIALGAFGAAYGAFMFALILAPDPKMWTMMVWIYQLQQGAGPGIVYASILITALPTLIVFICAQNVIMRGIIVPTEK